MPIQFPEYNIYNPWLSGAKKGSDISNNISDLLTKHLEQQKMRELMPFLAPEAQAKVAGMQQANAINKPYADNANEFSMQDLLKRQLENKNQQNINKYYAPNIQSEIGFRGAQTNKINQMLPGEVEKQKLENALYNRIEESKIKGNEALANYRNIGGGGAGVGGKMHLQLQQQIRKQFPNFNEEQIFDAANAYLEGRNTLSDGTKLPPAAGLIQSTLDQIVKQGTTSPLITQAIKSNQAHSELEVMDNIAAKDREPYANTILGTSPQQIMDSFKTDDESQKRLGRFIASQAETFEASQMRIRLAGANPSVTETKQLIKDSEQYIKTYFPRLSSKAREEARKRLNEYLSEGLKARNKIGLHPTDINKQIGGEENNDPFGMR